MGQTVHRSASTGRFAKTSTAKRNPRTTTTETIPSPGGATRSVGRSAITGRFVTTSTVARHPGTTITQQVSR